MVSTNDMPPPADLQVPALPSGSPAMDAALAYANAGFYVGPVAPGTKNPGSILGKEWQNGTTRDKAQIRKWFTGARNSKRGIFIHLGKSGCVAFDVDNPENLLDVISEAVKETQPPFQSTRTNVAGKGHYIFRQPAGRAIGNSLGALEGGWGEIRGTNGVIIVAPTVHEKASEGGCYEWMQTGIVPELPKALAELLTDAGSHDGAATPIEVDTFLGKHVAASDPGKLSAITASFEQKVNAGTSRHEAIINTLCWAMREASWGYFSARDAAEQLFRTFEDALGGERDASLEFNRALAWAIGQTKKAARVHRQRGGVKLQNLPQEFWDSRPSLKHIQTAAHSRTRSADVVFYSIMVRISAFASHKLYIDSPIGQASLNFFAAAVGPSGSGKTSGSKVAKELIRKPMLLECYELPIGSGEGVCEAYMGRGPVDTGEVDDKGNPKTKIVRRQTLHNALFYVDEGETLTKMQGRNGATIGPTLRSAWVGETIGQKNGNDETTRVIQANTYSMGLLVGFQPATVLETLNEIGSGMAQRFVWSAVLDPSIPRKRPDWPGPLDFDASAISAGSPKGIQLAPSIIEEIEDEQLENARWGRDEESADGHDTLTRMKIAALLAILEGRHKVTEDDWALSRIVWDTSSSVRNALLAHGRSQAVAEQKARENSFINREVKKAQAVAHATMGNQRAVVRIARNLANAIHGRGAHAGKDLSTLNKVKMGVVASRDRQHFDEAVAYAESQNWVVVDGSAVKKGASAPSGDVA